MTTEKQQTQVLTTCNGKINSFGFCDKCSQPNQGTSNYCGRLIPVNPTKQKTPLQKLIASLEESREKGDFDIRELIYEVKSFLPEEKQMVINAYKEGVVGDTKAATGEEYFNETFEQ